MSSRQFTPFGGSGEIVTLDNINEYDDLPPLAEIDSPDVYEIRTGELGTDYLVPMQDGSTDFNEWYSLVGGQIIRDITDSEANQKLNHRWVLDDVNGTVEDLAGNADGTNNGVTSVDGGWAGDSAGEADGSEYIETTTWGDFGSNMDTDFAIAASFKTADSGRFYGVLDDRMGILPRLLSDGDIVFQIRDNGDGRLEVTTDNTGFNDNNEHRVVMNKTGNTGSDLEIWVDQAKEPVTVTDDRGWDEVVNFTIDVWLFGANAGGSLNGGMNGIVDDICVFGDSLTQSEIDSYNNPWD